MPHILKTLFDRKRNEPTPEEIEALNRATLVLQWRVEKMIRPEAPKARTRAAA